MSPRTLYDRIQSGERIDLLDLRDQAEYDAWHITGETVHTHQLSGPEALSAVVNDCLADRIADTPLQEPITAVCPRGELSEEIATALTDAGMETTNLEGGMHGWARLYVPRSVDPVQGVIQFERPSSGCLGYLLVDDGEAAVVDPLRTFTHQYIEAARDADASIRWAIDTHVHADHISGIRRLAMETDATPVLPTGATDRGLAYDSTLLGDEDTLTVGSKTIQGVHAPGHTQELTALHWESMLCTGDALFLDSVGRPDLEDGVARAPAYAATIYETVTDILHTFPPETTLAPGHTRTMGPPKGNSSITASLSAVRDRLDLPNRDTFVSNTAEDLPPRPANHEQIIDINLGRDSVDEETAFELELGPNNCAVTPSQSTSESPDHW